MRRGLAAGLGSGKERAGSLVNGLFAVGDEQFEDLECGALGAPLHVIGTSP